jgi:hypothetical protein
MWKNLTDNIKQKTGIGGNQPNLQGSQTSGSGSGIQRRPTNATPVRPNNNLGQSGSNQGLGQSNNTNDINTEDWTEVLEEEEYIPAVELQDVMEDSPMLREKLHVLGQNVDVMAAKLRKIIKVSRTYQTSCKGK